MIIETVCRFCSSCCPIEAEVEGGRLIRARRKSFLEPEKRLSCAKLAAAAEIVYSPKRLTTPLIRQKDGSRFREGGIADEALDLGVS
jgi:anaerobic selenocysteine-containing dehydrogenase